MKQITIMVSKYQHRAYKKAASNFKTVSEWARCVFNGILFNLDMPFETDKNISYIAREEQKNRNRNIRISIKIKENSINALQAAARSSNIPRALFCVLLLDHECGISNLAYYLHSSPVKKRRWPKRQL